MGQSVSLVLSVGSPSVRFVSIKILYSISFKFDCEKQKSQKDSTFLPQVNGQPSAALGKCDIRDLGSCLVLH